jgi:sialate O-acetylesterase
MRRSLAVIMLLHLAGLSAEAVPSLHSLFSDHMVLQQGKPIPVWGKADPGEEIRVTLAGSSTRVTTRPDGRWRALLQPLTAGGPFTLLVEGKSRLQVHDVMIGEVWIASGQSNMHFALRAASTGAEDVPLATYHAIRLMTIPKATSLKPAEQVAGSWVQCSPSTAAGFSAVAYYFGLALHKKLGAPVGLIQSSWPGTSAEEWIDSAQLSAEPEFAPIAERWRAVEGRTSGPEERPLDFELQFDGFRLFVGAQNSTEAVKVGDFRYGSLANSLGGEWNYSWESAPLSSIELVQNGSPGDGFTLRSSGKLRSSDTAQIRADFRRGGEPMDLRQYAGLRFKCRGRGYFRVHILQPTIVDWDNYTTKVISAGTDWTDVTVKFSDLRQAGWGERRPFTGESLSGFVIELLPDPDGTRPPAGLFNGMIAPLLPYGLRGAIWYQGEGNAGRAYQYRKLLPTLIRSWRSAFQQDEFPFLFVQLPNFGARLQDPSESAWAELREAQLRTLELPATGMAVTIDIGEAGNVHPRNKRPVGQRLARWALGDVYHVEEVLSGPLFEAADVQGSRVQVRFRHTGSGLVALDGKPLRGFAVAGADRKFAWADARIDGEAVVVESTAVPAPVAVRYAWGANPDCNLGNREGLPASPFRTDEWPGLTAGSR